VPREDVTSTSRVETFYKRTARIYSKAKSIFAQETPNLDEKALRKIIEKVQGLNLLDSSSDSMQQAFMTFVPGGFQEGFRSIPYSADSRKLHGRHT
jgi:type I restriction enzyme M protein